MQETIMLFSGYGGENKRDITCVSVLQCGAMRRLCASSLQNQPSFCCVIGNTIYVAGEQDPPKITAMRLVDNELCLTGQELALQGSGLCHLFAHNNVIYASCYESADVFAVDAELENILWHNTPPQGGHAHWVSAVGNELFFADLGKDIVTYIGENGVCAQLALPKKSGPRQVIALSESVIAVICELDGYVRLFTKACEKWLAAGKIAASATGKDNYPAGACLSEDGALIVANRGPNTVSVLRLEGNALRHCAEWKTGNWPRHLATLPNGIVMVACQKENAVLVHDMKKNGVMLSHCELSGASCIVKLK